jgi:hypothetical protein
LALSALAPSERPFRCLWSAPLKTQHAASGFLPGSLEKPMWDSKSLLVMKEDIRRKTVLIELFATACALSIVSLLASIWLNDDEGGLT